MKQLTENIKTDCSALYLEGKKIRGGRYKGVLDRTSKRGDEHVYYRV